MKHRLLLMGLTLGLIASACMLTTQRRGRLAIARERSWRWPAWRRHQSGRAALGSDMQCPINREIDASLTSRQLPM